MIKVGRNDPCPCGSGKKFKKCCQTAVDAVDSEYRRLRRAEQNLLPRLLDYALDTFGPEAQQQAWDIFNTVEGDDEDDDADDEERFDFDPESPLNSVFIPWFLFNCEFQDMNSPTSPAIPIAQAFWIRYEDELTTDEIDFLDAAIGAPYSFYEVLEVSSSVGLKLCELFTQEEFNIVDRSGSAFKKGEVIYGTILEVGPFKTDLAFSVLPLGAHAKESILELREELTAELERTPTYKDLLDWDSELRSIYFIMMLEHYEPLLGDVELE